MPILSNVERKIMDVEGFKVAFIQNGADVRGDKSDIPQYGYVKKAPDSWTVNEWIKNRFKQEYSGYDVRVFTKAGTAASGNMKLENVRK